ncbi:uncharacterized protein LOC106659735 [Trichogramma pretiosum]|uniref:uncharacterized protein LOC106659735 n=1 Tax=Trichogramma pretiosum TaxID=7493 RepID=UPI000C71C006|nr:uncharacterized protein LOC106659735 [Trichogramma pretiosum]
MENGSDVIRIKEEQSDTLTAAGDDYVFDSVESCKAENLETFTFRKISKNFMELECKKVRDAKTEVTSLSATHFEHQSNPPIVKIENDNPTNEINENIFIDFECKYEIPELKSLSKTTCKSECESCPPAVKTENQMANNYLNDKFPDNLRLKLDKFEAIQIFEKRTPTKLSHKLNSCEKTYEGKLQSSHE